MSICKRCRQERPDEDFVFAFVKPWRKTRTAKWCKECRKKSILMVQRNQVKNYRRTLWYGAKHRAAKRGIAFDLCIDDIVIPTHCPALGIRLVPHIGDERGHNDSPTLDRIDPNLGYVRGNVAVISRMANAIKQNATARQILKVGLWLASRHEQSFKDKA